MSDVPPDTSGGENQTPPWVGCVDGRAEVVEEVAALSGRREVVKCLSIIFFRPYEVESQRLCGAWARGGAQPRPMNLCSCCNPDNRSGFQDISNFLVLKCLPSETSNCPSGFPRPDHARTPNYEPLSSLIYIYIYCSSALY